MDVYQIKVKFHVIEQIERYVYVYLIVGKHCYLIDSGVAGCQQQIIEQMHKVGKKISDLKGVFLTHAHPDHIGTAAWFKEQTGCKIYASKGEASWIENIDLQYKQRPIPNFYALAGKSVEVDYFVKDGDLIKLDETCLIKVIGTAGHSYDEVSYMVEDVMFIGDSVPVKGDIPIYIDRDASVKSLNRIRKETMCKWFYPAWDFSYDNMMILNKIDDAIKMMEEIDLAVKTAESEKNVKPENIEMKDLNKLVTQVCEVLHNSELINNPLFTKTVMSHLY